MNPDFAYLLYSNTIVYDDGGFILSIKGISLTYPWWWIGLVYALPFAITIEGHATNKLAIDS